jgi:hypothetical protein
MSKQYRMSRRVREGWERAKAEDHIVNYLSRCPTREQSAAVAIRVEMYLAAKWEIEQREFWRHESGDRFVFVTIPERLSDAKDREFVLMTPDELNEIKQLFAETPLAASDYAAEQYVLDTLSKFHTDRARWIAHLVRSYLVFRRGVERSRKSKAGPTTTVPAPAPIGSPGPSSQHNQNP